MNRRKKLYFWIPVIIVASFFFASFGKNEEASAYSVWADPYVILHCEDSGSQYNCSVNLWAELIENNYNWCQAVSNYIRLSSEYRSTKTYYMGYRDCCCSYLLDAQSYEDTYGFSISYDTIKREGYSYREGGYMYWDYPVSIHWYSWWDTNLPREDAEDDIWETVNISLVEKVSSTFTIKAIDENGNSLQSIFPDQKIEVDPDERAYLCARSSSGYSKIKWGTSTWSGSWWDNKDLCYDAGYIEEDLTIYAVYVRDEFAGRARAWEGKGTSGYNYVDTGYVETDTDRMLNIECLDSGCDVTFDLSLKTVKGEGSVNYKAKYTMKYNDYSYQVYGTYPTSPFSPSASGTIIQIPTNGVLGNYVTDTLKPGETLCYMVVFTPKGSLRDDLERTAKACVHAKESTFEGKVDVKGAVNGTTTWKNETTTVTKTINSCTYAAPCRVSFDHYLRRTSGIGGVKYTITRSANDSGFSSGTIKNNVFEGFSSVSNYQAIHEYASPEMLLRPGQRVCEELKFADTNSVLLSGSKMVYLKTCAMALGDAQPPDPNTPDNIGDDVSDAFIDMRVKNNSGANKYRSYQKVVYAKPGDNLSYRASYNPILQYTYGICPDIFQIDGTTYPQYSDWYCELNRYFNHYYSPGWKNAFNVSSNSSFSYAQNYTFTIGSTTKQTKYNTYNNIPVGKVGKALAETAKTNTNTTVSTTPSQVRFTSPDGTQLNANVITASKESSAEARVSYNFDTKVDVDVPENPDERILYSGEDDEFKYTVDVLPRPNPETTNSDDEKYATIVPDSISRLIIYQPGIDAEEKPGTDAWPGGGGSKQTDLCAYYGLVLNNETCKYANEKTGSLNSTGNKNGSSNSYTMLYDVPDLPAGSKICIAVAVYPSNSGAYTNYNDPEGNHMWRISDSKCYTIAKRPTFQVWGGSLYSGGTITTSAATKKTLRYLPTYTGVMVFGSWVEQSVTSFGKAIALASGAAGGNGDYLATGLGGSHEEPGSDYCKYRVPLSLANYNAGALSLLCPSAQASGSSGISAKLLTRESLTGRLPNEDSLSNNYEGDTTIEFNNETPKNIVRYNVGGNTTINAATINTGKTHIINSNGNVYINGNILYQSATYTELNDIPKVIIYGKNVIIGCTVTQIDAIVAAEEILDTCETPTDSDINREQNSHQLTVNGAIITNVLKLNRTYGAAWGIHSSKPGEIVNYDTSTILWGRAKADPDNKHRNLTSVYMHELAPRY